jgi:hypothetical protein
MTHQRHKLATTPTRTTGAVRPSLLSALLLGKLLLTPQKCGLPG